MDKGQFKTFDMAQNNTNQQNPDFKRMQRIARYLLGGGVVCLLFQNEIGILVIVGFVLLFLSAFIHWRIHKAKQK